MAEKYKEKEEEEEEEENHTCTGWIHRIPEQMTQYRARVHLSQLSVEHSAEIDPPPLLLLRLRSLSQPIFY